MIQKLHDFIINTLSEKIEPVQSADYYCTEKGQFATPALYLELTELHSKKKSDGSLGCTAHFQLDCIVANKSNTAHIDAQHLALESAYQLSHAEFYKAEAKNLHIRTIRSNDFSPDYEGAKAWTVEFSAEFTWGESSFNFVKPDKAFVGIAPKTGPKHIDDYREYDLGQSNRDSTQTTELSN
ncbi:hypothetical protein [Piscirickettsia litoralis]|uniref:Uncharacterized protein n=1 Tax=Piscirickettsia litoralis TaxID=1891921 RepID=A0ABX3A0L3_9GAMM|nr:hypothetical protein [Piscirickettsia litoralis]ODN41168.1 hypothetical protein BGC07_18005 [Piscirickettsia litoralis]